MKKPFAIILCMILCISCLAGCGGTNGGSGQGSGRQTEHQTVEARPDPDPVPSADCLELIDGRSWHFIDDGDGTAYVMGITFDKGGSGSYYVGIVNSEMIGDGTVRYSSDGDLLTIELNEGSSKSVYRLEPDGNNVKMTQESEGGLFFYMENGYVIELIPGLYAD